MKQTLTFFTAGLLMLMAYTVKAQDNNDSDDESKPKKLRSYVGLSMGVSYALGDFAKADYSNNKAGFANRGVVFQLDGAIYVYRHFGIGYTITKQDQSNFSYDDDLILGNGYAKDFKADGATVTADKRYRSYNFLLGPQYTFTWRRLAFDLRASAGAIKSQTSPQLTISVTGVDAQSGSIVQQSAKGYAFAYGGSAAIRFDMGAGWGLSLKGNYVKSDGYDVTTTGRTLNVGRLVTKQPITEGQIVFGLTKAF
ncbi:hypothetical protein [Mucilaginibacter celer]|uniref:Outer membrane protein beta-barrel domain-containing protein n=1 Tax=Mucilaginibacter celer TaxID=2305508 RepID=A0A494W4R3_9SPHI|nr:hypothetical protein [Mucilaginibacter celer]AYL98538.1 hypothetical protein HYN43_026100 [Mucilaginibacter celer]